MFRLISTMTFALGMILLGMPSAFAQDKPDLTVSCGEVSVTLTLEGDLTEGNKIECPGETIVDKMVVLNLVVYCDAREITVRVTVKVRDNPTPSTLELALPCGKGAAQGERYIASHEEVCETTTYYVVVSEGEIGVNTFVRVFEGEVLLTCSHTATPPA